MKSFKQFVEAAIHRSYNAIVVDKGERKNDELHKKQRTPHSAKDIVSKYKVKQQGEKVGTINQSSYHGDVTGSLHGKQLPNIEKYAPYSTNPVTKLHSFLRTSRGRKWASTLNKDGKDENSRNV